MTLEWYEHVNITEWYLDIVNPSSPGKLLLVGEVLGLRPGMRVIDFASGFGQPLALWAERFGISGVGVEIREHACDKARRRLAERNVSDRVEIVCADASTYAFEPGAYDVACCIGATFIWGGFQPAIQRLRAAAKPGGRLVVGEPYWRHGPPPKEHAEEQGISNTEADLLRLAHEERYDIEYVVRSSIDDWDRYEAGNWRGAIRWARENPSHPEVAAIAESMRRRQTQYMAYDRENFGWAIYVLNPVVFTSQGRA